MHSMLEPWADVPLTNEHIATAFKLYRGALTVYAGRTLAIHRRAEDLVADTFLQALRSKHTFQGRSTLRSWLTGILINRIRTTYNQSIKYDIQPLDFPLEERMDLSCCPHTYIDTTIDAIKVMHQIGAFNVTILRLRFEGYSYADISKRTGLPPDTLRVRYHRAIHRLMKSCA